MYARVISAAIAPKKMEQAIRIYRDAVVQLVEKQKGFKGAFFLTDPARSKAVSITLWDSEPAMKAGEASGFVDQQIARFANVFIAPPEQEAFEVSVVSAKI